MKHGGFNAILSVVLVLCSIGAVGAQTVRETFRTGSATPAGWTLSGGAGRWEAAAARGGPYVSVTGTGDDTNYWRFSPKGLQPNTSYRIRFQAKVAAGSSTSTVISGLDACNRDFGVTDQWQPYTFVFTTPEIVSGSFLRLGQWHLHGTVLFRDLTLSPVNPVFRRVGAQHLGDGERLSADTYTFQSTMDGEGSNTSRTSASHTAPFNSNRWVFSSGLETVYRFSIPGASQTGGRFGLNVSYYTGGDCVASASTDGKAWTEIGRWSGTGLKTATVPASLYPCKTLLIRIRGAASASAAGNSEPGAFQVDGLGYEAKLDRRFPDAAGATAFLDVTRQDPRLIVTVDGIGSVEKTGSDVVQMTLHPAAGFSGAGEATLTLSSPRKRADLFRRRFRLKGGADVSVGVPYAWNGTGTLYMALAVTVGGQKQALFSAHTDRLIASYYASNYGYLLNVTPFGALWWCEDTYKINPNRIAPMAPITAAPVATGMNAFGSPPSTSRRIAALRSGRPSAAVARESQPAVTVSAARRERAAVQLVYRPSVREPASVRVSASALSGPDGAHIPLSAIEIREVAYVPVRVPTDRIGVADEWPDPLPLLDGDWNPKPGRNNPLWITITVPSNAPAGDYTGTIVLRSAAWRQAVPLRLHVWNFSLPEHTSLRSGFGISADNIRRFHNLKSQASLAEVWDGYMKNFAAHRLCPYNPMNFGSIDAKLTGDKDVPDLTLDFAGFDREARHYLDEMGFNSFTIPFPGLGNGRFPNYDTGTIQGFPPTSANYDRMMRQYGEQLQDHLERKGWLNKAYVYWYDEPEENDYPFVVRGMEKLKKYAPKLKRMLTEEFNKPLWGNVDLWCPITPNFNFVKSAARQKQGEEVWWYVCTGPKEPYCALFIDHPAVEMRMWLWQTWKFRVQGILIWETTWWTSPAQFPADHPQNCWEDPMSYTDGAGGVWGNGDGRFFYPPKRRAGDDSEIIAPPIPSQRWELLGAGVQDWEYFHLLDGLVNGAASRRADQAKVRNARKLLAIPDSICTDMTHFAGDPQPMLRYRAAMARSIEELSRRPRR